MDARPGRARVRKWAKPYPARSAVWKKTIATDHTCGAPPNRGSTILVNIGCTANMSAALRKMAPVRAASISRGEDGVGAGAGASPVPALRRRRTMLREDGGAAALPAEDVPIA